MNASSFFSTYYSAAKNASEKTGIPALLILAQSALETGFGKSTPGNMFFGIKAGTNYSGKKQLLWTHEYVKGKLVKVQAWFRAYNSPADSFSDWANFIKTNKRYAKVLTSKDTITGAKELQKSGYSTSPTYADSLISVASSLSPGMLDASDVLDAKARLAGAKIKTAVGTTSGKIALILLGVLAVGGAYINSQGMRS